MQLGYGEKEECVQNFDGETCWKVDISADRERNVRK
jgi:hypothetical protein